MELCKTLKRGIVFTVILALCLTLMAAFATEETFAASKTHLKKTALTLTIGATYQQKLLSSNNKTISSSKIKWSSNNTKVAKVTKKGKVTAVKTGTATIKAKYKGKTYSCKVKVIKGTSGKDYYYITGSGQTRTIDIRWKRGFSDSITADIVSGKSVVGIVDAELVETSDPDWVIYRLEVKGYKSGTAVIRIIPESLDNYDVVAKNGMDITIEIGTLTDSLVDLTIHNLKTKMIYPDSLTVFKTEVKWIENNRHVQVEVDFEGRTDTGKFLRDTYIMNWRSEDGINWDGKAV